MSKSTNFSALFGILALVFASYGIIGDFTSSETPAFQCRLHKDGSGRLDKHKTLDKDYTLGVSQI